jgi:hypothetical protein
VRTLVTKLAGNKSREMAFEGFSICQNASSLGLFVFYEYQT